MARGKQFVFSARTTEDGLKLLNGLKAKMGMGWDEFVIEGMSGHYQLDKAILSLPKKATASKEQGKKPAATKKKTTKKAPSKVTPAEEPTGTETTEPPPPEQ